MTKRVDLAMSVCPSVSTQTSLSVLKLSGWNFPKSLIYFAGSILVGTSRIGQLYLIEKFFLMISLVVFNTYQFFLTGFSATFHNNTKTESFPKLYK